MSAIANAVGELIQQSNNVAANSSWTAMCWVRVLSTPAAGLYRTIFTRVNAGYTAWSGIFCDLATNDFRISTNDGVTDAFTSAQTLTVNQWIHLGYVKSGNTHRFYVNGVLFSQTTLNINAVAFTDLYAAGDTFDSPDTEIAMFREWNAVLSTPDVVSEMNSASVIRTSGLITNTPLISDLLDISGNGNNWSSVGSITFGTSIAIPTNAGFAGAIDIVGLPFTANQNLVVSGFAFDGWYKHTGISSYNLGIWGFGDLVTFMPTVEVYESDGVTRYPAISQISAINIPLQVPFVGANQKYFRYIPNSRTLAVANLVVNAQQSPNESIPLGSICVPDDTAEGDFKLGIFSAIDGDDYHVLVYKDFPAGESGDSLDNGFILVQDEEDNSIKGFNASYAQVFSIASRPMASTFGCIRQCRGTQRWWVLYLSGGTQYVARFVTDAGVEGTAHNVATLASAEDPYCLAVDNTEAILYYGEATAGSDSIKNFNLATDTLIGTFAAAPGANYKVADILVLSNGNIVAYWASIVDDNIQVIQYNAAGVVQTTKNLGNGFVFPLSIRGRMTYSLDDPDSVWVWVHPSTPMAGTSKFMEIELSTGNILKTILQQEYEIGEYNSVPTATPERFGNSFSCPFWVATTGVAPPSTGTLTVAKLSDPFSGAHIFTVDVASGLSPAVLSLVSDDAGHTYDPVPVGIYSVVERVDPDWTPVYFVSNDVNNNNLAVSVGAGENVTVIVLNTAQSPGGGTYELTPSGPGGPDVPTDTFINGDGSVTVRGIPPPFIITGFIRDA